MKVQNPGILIVEDDENDRFFIQAAFRKVGVKTPIQMVNNGQQAIAYLNGEGRFADRKQFPFPTTIVTDLKMPIMDGFAVLQHIKSNPQWAVIPTVVLSASSDLDDIKKAYMLGASAYHIKPATSEELRQQLKVLHDYWITCEAPQTTESGHQLETQSRGKLGERFVEQH